jgi:hypothetical protein
MPIKPEHFTLHRYFLNASRNRSLFLSKLQEGALDQPHTRIHLDLWYRCLYVVIEGWRKERIDDPATTDLLRDGKRVNLLAGHRNATFHYHPEYVESRAEALYTDPGFVHWVDALHDAISDFFLRETP